MKQAWDGGELQATYLFTIPLEGPFPSAHTKRNTNLPNDFPQLESLYKSSAISLSICLPHFFQYRTHLTLADCAKSQRMQPRDPNPDGLEDIQAVLNSFCQIPNPTTPPSPGFNCENLPDNFTLNDISFFSPSTIHEPIKAIDSDNSAATPSPEKSSPPNIRRRQPNRVTRAQTSRARKNLTKPSARTNTKTRQSRQRRKQKVTVPSASHLPTLPIQKNDNVVEPAADAIPIANGRAYSPANDDMDTGHFIHQMRRLTELKLQVCFTVLCLRNLQSPNS